MALAFGVAVVLGQAVGFWVRRGRPGLLALLLQRLGARVFRRWYVDNLPYALSPPLYDAARDHLQREIVADPEAALDPEALDKLEGGSRAGEARISPAKRGGHRISRDRPSSRVLRPAAAASSPAPRPR